MLWKSQSLESGTVLIPVLGTSIVQIPRMDPLPWVIVRTFQSKSKAKDTRGPSNASMARHPGNTCYPS